MDFVYQINHKNCWVSTELEHYIEIPNEWFDTFEPDRPKVDMQMSIGMNNWSRFNSIVDGFSV